MKSEDIKHQIIISSAAAVADPVWPSGKALVSGGTSVRIRFGGSPFSSKGYGLCQDTVLWLSASQLSYETLKLLSPLPTLMQKSFGWWQCSDRYTTSLPTTPPPPQSIYPLPPFSPSLISLMVSVDVKQHGYISAVLQSCCRLSTNETRCPSFQLPVTNLLPVWAPTKLNCPSADSFLRHME